MGPTCSSHLPLLCQKHQQRVGSEATQLQFQLVLRCVNLVLQAVLAAGAHTTALPSPPVPGHIPCSLCSTLCLSTFPLLKKNKSSAVKPVLPSTVFAPCHVLSPIHTSNHTINWVSPTCQALFHSLWTQPGKGKVPNFMGLCSRGGSRQTC